MSDNINSNEFTIHKIILTENGYLHHSFNETRSIDETIDDYKERFKKNKDWKACYIFYGKIVMEEDRF